MNVIDAGKDSIARRLASILSEVKSRGFDTVVFVNEIIGRIPANFFYVSGSRGYNEEHAALFAEHSALIFDIDGRSTIVMPHWHALTMEKSGLYDHAIPVKEDKEDHIRGIKEGLERYHDAKAVCFDLSTMSAQFAFQLANALGLELTKKLDISDHVFKLRATKDEYEIGEIKKAIKITEEAVVEFAINARPGTSCEDLKKRMDASMIEKGAVELCFDSKPKFRRGRPRPPGIIKHGDLLTIDVGCRMASGYCSDMGRTIPISPDSEVKDYLDRALAAHKESIKSIKQGIMGNEVFEEANRINIEFGLESDPVGRCGHQIGLEVHDYTMPFAPNFGPLEVDKQPLREGMTVTFEPSHRDAKKNLGSFIEDIVLVTRATPIILNELPWDFLW